MGNMMHFLSVVVDELDALRASVSPDEDESPLVVDSDAVEALKVSSESLEPVSWRRAQIEELVGCVDHVELPLGGPYEAGLEPGDSSGGQTVEDVLGEPVTEADDHGDSVG